MRASITIFSTMAFPFSHTFEFQKKWNEIKGTVFCKGITNNPLNKPNRFYNKALSAEEEYGNLTNTTVWSHVPLISENNWEHNNETFFKRCLLSQTGYLIAELGLEKKINNNNINLNVLNNLLKKGERLFSQKIDFDVAHDSAFESFTKYFRNELDKKFINSLKEQIKFTRKPISLMLFRDVSENINNLKQAIIDLCLRNGSNESCKFKETRDTFRVHSKRVHSAMFLESPKTRKGWRKLVTGILHGLHAFYGSFESVKLAQKFFIPPYNSTFTAQEKQWELLFHYLNPTIIGGRESVHYSLLGKGISRSWFLITDRLFNFREKYRDIVSHVSSFSGSAVYNLPLIVNSLLKLPTGNLPIGVLNHLKPIVSKVNLKRKQLEQKIIDLLVEEEKNYLTGLGTEAYLPTNKGLTVTEIVKKTGGYNSHRVKQVKKVLEELVNARIVSFIATPRGRGHLGRRYFITTNLKNYYDALEKLFQSKFPLDQNNDSNTYKSCSDFQNPISNKN